MALDWLEERLKVSLGFDQTKEIADYLYKIEDNDELRDYLEAFLGNTEDTRSIVNDIINYKKTGTIKSIEKIASKTTSKPATTSTKIASSNNKNSKASLSSSPPPPAKSILFLKGDEEDKKVKSPEEKVELLQNQMKNINITKGKTRKKGKKEEDKSKATIYFTEPKECKCNCQATLHKLLINCTECGFILCEKDNGNIFCTYCKAPLNQSLLPHFDEEGKTDVDDIKENELNTSDRQLINAIERKNRLLAFDKNTVEAGRIFDDQGDYFNSSDMWIDKKDREIALERENKRRDKLHTRKRTNRIQFDIGGRRIVMVDSDEEEENDGYKFEDIREKIPLQPLLSSIKPAVDIKSIPTSVIDKNNNTGIYSNKQLKGRGLEIYNALSEKLKK